MRTSGRRPHYLSVKNKGRFRSLYERRIAAYLSSKGIKYGFETRQFKYFTPSRNNVICPNCGVVRGLVERTYTPDFVLANGVFIEAKGRLLAKDRSKLRAVVKQHPTLDLRLLFQKDGVITESRDKIRYTEWAKSFGIPSAIGPEVPSDWYAGRNRPKRLEKAYREDLDYDNQVVPSDNDDSDTA